MDQICELLIMLGFNRYEEKYFVRMSTTKKEKVAQTSMLYILSLLLWQAMGI